VLANGTAVVVTPIGSITQIGKDREVTTYEIRNNEIGEMAKQLYQKVHELQNDEEEDKYRCNYKIINE
jgi:branched-subunit amino acid aminotransferase/4-amino-4-deoxychorismate lyase